MRHFALIIFTLFVSCNDKPIKTIKDTTKESIIFSDNYVICDTCKTTILVHHNECTTCGEITVDSGTVYLTKEILTDANKLVDKSEFETSSGKRHKKIIPPNYVRLKELYFLDKHYFSKLWTDTIDFKDLYKAFRLTGKVVEIKRRVLDNGVVEIYPSLFFKVDKAVQVDTSYLRKIMEN